MKNLNEHVHFKKFNLQTLEALIKDKDEGHKLVIYFFKKNIPVFRALLKGKIDSRRVLSACKFFYSVTQVLNELITIIEHIKFIFISNDKKISLHLQLLFKKFLQFFFSL